MVVIDDDESVMIKGSSTREKILELYERTFTDEKLQPFITDEDTPNTNEDLIKYYEEFCQEIEKSVSNLAAENLEDFPSWFTIPNIKSIKSDVSEYYHSVSNVRSSIEELQKEWKHSISALTAAQALVATNQSQVELVQALLEFQSSFQKFKTIRDKEPTESSMAQAKLIGHLLSFFKNNTLSLDINYVSRVYPEIQDAASKMQRFSRESLRVGMEEMNQTVIGKALQMSFVLQRLPTVVQDRINMIIEASEMSVNQLLNTIETKQSSTITAAGVWNVFVQILEMMSRNAMQVWNLQRVLVKLRDHKTSRIYLDMVVLNGDHTNDDDSSSGLFYNFWEVLCAILAQHVEAFKSKISPPLDSILKALYPKLRVEIVSSVMPRLWTATSTKASGDATLSRLRATEDEEHNSSAVRAALGGVGNTTEECELLLSVFDPMLHLYKQSLYNSMAKPILQMFPQNAGFHSSPPSRSDMKVLTNILKEEKDLLKNTDDDSTMNDVLNHEVVKAVKLLCANMEAMVNTDISFSTGAYSRTGAQAHNMTLVALLYQVEDVLLREFKSDDTQEALDVILDLGFSIASPYFIEMALAMEKILGKMHVDSFANESKGESVSAYVVEFSSAFTTITNDHLKKLCKSRVVLTCKQDLVGRIITNFVRQASLLRPLEEKGKLRLANDLAQVELLMECVTKLSDVKRPYEELRAFRQLIFMETDEILHNPIVDQMRPSNVWHHLISRAPDELQMPHRFQQVSTTRYIDWLETKAGGEFDTFCPLAYPSLHNLKWSMEAEKIAWKKVLAVLELYAERRQVLLDDNHDAYDTIISEAGAVLLAGYELSITS